MEQDPAKPKFKPAEAIQANALVEYQAGSIVSREIVRGAHGRISVFAFDQGEGLSEHVSPFDALVQILEGEAEITISGKPHRVKGGDMILMPAQQTHALRAVHRFKMILTLIRPQNEG
jgi:quercetin dioxygenase-like cupin family protein